MAGTLKVNHILAQFENWAQDATGLSAADNGWFPASIYEQFLASRATDILEVLTKEKSTVNKFVQQTLGCIEFEETPVEECPCAPPSGCTWFKSSRPLPNIIGDMIAVTAIGGNLEKLEHYTYCDWQAVKFRLNSRIPAERTRGYYCIRNHHIYILVKSKIRALSIAAIFYDPVEAQRYPLCGQVPSRCNSFVDDYDLYIDPGKYQKLLATTFQLITGMRNGAVLDTTNNAQPAVAKEPTRPY